MTDERDLAALLERARNHKMTEAEIRAQRVSWVMSMSSQPTDEATARKTLGLPTIEEAATLAGLRGGSLVAVPREPTEAIIDAMAEAHADAFACARASGTLRLAPAQWLPLVWNAILAAAKEDKR
jgi:hypothetical protein